MKYLITILILATFLTAGVIYINNKINPVSDTPGAYIPADNDGRAMQKIDAKLLNVPEEYKAQKVEFNKKLEGKMSTIILDGTNPALRFTVKDKNQQERWVEILLGTPPNTAVTPPKKTNSSISWEDIFPGVDARYDVYDGFIKETFYLKHAGALRDFYYKIKTSENIELSDKEGGYIKATDKNTHEYLFMLRPPQGLDSKQYRIDYRYELKDDTLHLVPNRPWQFDYATFPVAVDPSISTIAWEEALVNIGEDCPTHGCDKDGDILDIRPAGWNWGISERQKFVIIKIPKLEPQERETYLSQTIKKYDDKVVAEGKESAVPDDKKDRVYKAEGLKRYGIDYTQLVSPEELVKIRSKEEINPVLDATNKPHLFRKKQDPMISMIPAGRRLAYKAPKEPGLLTKIIRKIVQPVFAQATITKSIGTSSRNYSTMTAWEAGEQGNLVSLNEVHKGEMYNDGADFLISASTRISGSTTDSTRYMWLTVASGERHAGKSGSTNVRIDCQSSTTGIQMEDDYTRLEWIEIFECDNSNGRADIRFEPDDDATDAIGLLVQYVIARGSDGDATTTGGMTFGGSTSGTTVTVRNSLIYDAGDSGIRGNDPLDELDLQNVTVYSNTSRGVYEDSSIYRVKNVVSLSNPTADFDAFSNGSSTISNSISSDATGTLTSRTATTNCSPGAGNWIIFVNITASSEDFHLQNCAENDAQNGGTTIGTFSDDIDLDTRPLGSAWDIGADEVAEATNTPTPTPTNTPPPVFRFEGIKLEKLNIN